MLGGAVRSRTKVGGVEVEVLEQGTEGPHILFLHSSWGPAAQSTKYLDLLASKYRVIAPFHPGYGQIARPKNFRDVGDLAYFYLDFIEHRNLNDIILVGASFGGWLASEIAVRSTSRIARLVLVSPFGVKVRPREDRDFVDFFALETAERAELEFDNPNFRVVDYASLTDEELTVIARGREAEVHYGWKPFMHNPQLRYWLHRIKIPTLIVRGLNDRVVSPENHAAYLRLLPDSRMATIDDAGHHPHVEQPKAFLNAIQAFAPHSTSEHRQ